LSRHTRAHYLLDPATSLDAQAMTIATAFHRLAPAVLVPCDDAAFDLLGHARGAPLPGVPDDVREGLRQLVETSLGDPAGYVDSVDKLRFPARARRAGVATPRSAVCARDVDARAFAAETGYPVVLKRAFSFGGRGVAVCTDAQDLARAFARLTAGTPGAALLAQEHLDGITCYTAALAWRGELLCCHAVEQIERMPLGASTVVRYRHDAAMVDATARLVREFGISGLAGTEFLQAGDTAHVIEINRRVTPGLHRAPSIGIDYLRTWADALAGRAPARRAVMDEAASRVFVHFPMEWMRDPMSPYLVYQPLDAPRDDPRLLAALLDLGWKVNRLRDTA
jgi:hypothetical protein